MGFKQLNTGVQMLLNLRYLGAAIYLASQFFLLSAGGCMSAPLDPVYIDITGIDKSLLIVAFFNYTPLQTHVIRHDFANSVFLSTGGIIKKLEGKKLNINVSKDFMDVASYNKLYGKGQAERIILDCRNNDLE